MSPDYPVLISYSQLQELLKAPQEMSQFRTQIELLCREIEVLRRVQRQCLDIISELRSLVEQ